jgi:hypothetical protein
MTNELGGRSMITIQINGIGGLKITAPAGTGEELIDAIADALGPVVERSFPLTADDWKLSRCVHCGETGNDCRCPIDDPPEER